MSLLKGHGNLIHIPHQYPIDNRFFRSKNIQEIILTIRYYIFSTGVGISQCHRSFDRTYTRRWPYIQRSIWLIDKYTTIVFYMSNSPSVFLCMLNIDRYGSIILFYSFALLCRLVITARYCYSLMFNVYD